MMLGRLQVPSQARRGEAFEIRLLMQHPMETGYRRDFNGQAIPMHIIDKVVCRVAGREVFSAELGTGISANPYISFFAMADASGLVEVEWSDNRSERGRAVVQLNVAG